MAEPIRTIHIGCGPIGCSIVRLVASRSTLRIVGAVDLAEDKVGRDLGELAALQRLLNVAVSAQTLQTVESVRPHIAIHSTASSLQTVHQQILQLVQSGTNVVSTCEELAFPYGDNVALGDSIDAEAKKHGVTVLGTGINPGFLMDAWPLFMSGVCQNVSMVRITRLQDASRRRLPFQQKIGAGCTHAEFQRRVDQGTLRHVGLTESMAMIASGFGWELDDLSERIEPIFADRLVKTPSLTVEPGCVAGVRQIGWGLQGGKARIIAEFRAAVGAQESYDEVAIQGVPDLRVRIEGGTHGDIGTTAVVVNAIPRVVQASPGLLTMKDIPVIVATPAD